MLDICIFFPFLQSPLVLGDWFSVLEGEHREQLLPPSLVLSIQESVAQNSSTKYPNRLTSSGRRKSQLLLLKALCIEYKRFCVSGNKMSLFKFTLYTLGSKMMLLTLDDILLVRWWQEKKLNTTMNLAKINICRLWKSGSNVILTTSYWVLLICEALCSMLYMHYLI